MATLQLGWRPDHSYCLRGHTTTDPYYAPRHGKCTGSRCHSTVCAGCVSSQASVFYRNRRPQAGRRPPALRAFSRNSEAGIEQPRMNTDEHGIGANPAPWLEICPTPKSAAEQFTGLDLAYPCLSGSIRGSTSVFGFSPFHVSLLTSAAADSSRNAAVGGSGSMAFMRQERPPSRGLAFASSLAAARTVRFVRAEGAEVHQPPLHSVFLRHEGRAPTASLRPAARPISHSPPGTTGRPARCARRCGHWPARGRSSTSCR